MFDITVIGAGVIGGAIARELGKYDLKVCILEKENDVAMGTTKANSAIIHAGFDAVEGSLKAKLNVKGSMMMETLTQDLGVKYKKNGSLVIGFNESDLEQIKVLYKRGVNNGVKDLKILKKEELKSIEPNITDAATCALYAPTGAIICPYELTLALIGNAMDNGVELYRNFAVEKIDMENDSYQIFSDDGQKVESRYVINCAGLFSDSIAKMVGDNSFNVTPRRGEYLLLDNECGNIIKHTIFRTPTKMGKGILVSPTVDGNILVGPTGEDVLDKNDFSTTIAGLNKIIKEGGENVENLPLNKVITSFCGLRAVGDTGDFIITMNKPRFINLGGIESPGLSASPAIAEYVLEMLSSDGLTLTSKQNFISKREAMHHFREASFEEKKRIIDKDKRYGKIICRCEGVSEGEIIKAIKTNPKPLDLDGVKRRTRAQMGRCQGGFCTPYIMKLLAEEMGVSMCEVTKKGGASYMLSGKIKDVE